ncbi:aminobenzoyl-glutamate transport protein [Tetragenococcus muriaticus 3MR10-3]|uniref:Aminobenzoyl-glutamate transport protein n=2 Tax=Tetragenococcus muriaticus TaxID=64642 RepID=A0A091BVE0_9ENTE|nr:aminobenzoyl-glutamate transport protein [Tetragenococcus muriaticus 3MR10-3]
MFNSAVDNFTGFAPLGTVLVTMLGVGVAEWTGLIASTLKRLLSNVPAFLLSASVVFAGIISNIASDVGYIVIIPLGALIFAGAGRHPLAGLAAAFAGVSGGFSANLLVGPLDAIVVEIANEALSSAGINYEMSITANWYFMVASTILLTIVGALVTDKFVEPRLGEYKGDYRPDFESLSKVELKGLRNALIVLVVYAVIMGILMFPQGALFRSYDEALGTESINNFLSSGLLLGIFLLFVLPGLAYGITVGKIKNFF